MNSYFQTPVQKRTGKRTKVRLPKRLAREEVKALLEAPNRDAITGLRNRCMLELMYRAGLRVSEVCNLEIRDINLKKREIYVFDGKGGDRVVGWYESKLDAYLEEWKRRRKHETRDREAGPRGYEYFFCTIEGGQVSTRYVQQMIHRMARRAGIQTNVTPHMLRHTFASEYLEAGGKIELLQMLLGHKNIATTQIYMHLQPQDALASLQQMKRAE